MPACGHPYRMTSTPEQPRPASARQRLHAAMEALIVGRGYDGFTVGDLLEHAAVSRSSFYAHYRDKDDLLLQGFETLGPPPAAVAGTGLPDLAQWLFNGTAARKPLASTLLSRSSRSVVCQHLENTLVVLVRDALRGGPAPVTAPMPDLTLEPSVRFYVGALMGLWLWWVDHDYPLPADVVASVVFDS